MQALGRETLFAAAIGENVLPEVRGLFGVDWAYWRGVCDSIAAAQGRKADYTLADLLEALIMGVSTQAEIGSVELQLLLHSMIVMDMQTKWVARKGNFIPSADADARCDFCFQVVMCVEAIRARLRQAPGVDRALLDRVCTELVQRMWSKSSPLICTPGPLCTASPPMLVWPCGTTFADKAPGAIWT